MAGNFIGLWVLLVGVVILLIPAITGATSLNLQGGPTITSFTAESIPGSDNFVNINDKMRVSCSASDPAGIKDIRVSKIYTDGTTQTFFFASTCPSPNQATTTCTDTTISTSYESSDGPTNSIGAKVPGTYQFFCKVTNKNDVTSESAKVSLTFPAQCASCSVQEWGSCSKQGSGAWEQQKNIYGCSESPEYVCVVNSTEKRSCDPCSSSVFSECTSSTSCTAAGGKWCTGTSSSSSYCDPVSSACTISSNCGNGMCDRGEFLNGNNMCPKDCGGQQWQTPSNTNCGNDICDSSESQVSCSVDCGISPGYANGCGTGACGDGACNINCNVQEDYGICYTDCPKTSQTTPMPSITPEKSNCGGITGLTCNEGYKCVYENGESSPPYPDATGICNLIEGSSISSTVTVLLDKPLIIPTKILTTSLEELGVPEEVAVLSGATKLTIDASKDIEANAVIQITVFDSIPSIDDKNQKLRTLPSVSQIPIKIIQFAPSNELIEAVRKITIEFVLKTEEMLANKLSPEDIVMLRFSDGRWVELPTTYTGKTESGHFFESVSPGFSVFVITKRASSTVASPEPIVGCSADSDCVWQSTNGCSEESGAIWKCKPKNAPLLSGSEDKSCSNLYMPKPNVDTCGCIESVDGQKRCAPVEAKTIEDKNLLKSSLLDAVITLGDFKTRFDYLAKRSKRIADYYLSLDNSRDYATWIKASQSFVNGMFRLDSVRMYIKSIKDKPTLNDIDLIDKEINDILRILDSSINFLLSDVLNIGSLSNEQTVALAVGQSVVFNLDGENHTLTVKSIEDGNVKFLIKSYPTTFSVQFAEEKKLSLSDSSPSPDTSIKVDKVEKNVVYIRLNSALSETFAVAGEVTCEEVTSDMTLGASHTQACYHISVDGVVFDGGGRKIDGNGLGYGILVSGRKGVTIKNIVLENFINGIKLVDTKNSTISNVIIRSVAKGIELVNSEDNVILGNTVEIGTRLPQTEVKLEDLVALNEVLLYDGPDAGSYAPYLSITSNTRPQINDISGNPIEAMEFTIQTEDLNVNGQPVKYTSKVSLRKGQTALVDSGAIIYPDNKGDANVRITVSAEGYKDQKIDKKINVDGGL